MSQSTETSAGKAVHDFETAAAECKMMEATAPLDFEGSPPLEVTACVEPGSNYRKYFVRNSDGHITERFHSLSLAEVMVAAAQKFSNGKLNIAAISINANKHPNLTRAQLTKLAVDAWCEVFGITAPSDRQFKQMTDGVKASQEKARKDLLDALRSGPKGVDKWNKLSAEERSANGPLRKMDLSGADLSQIHFSGSYSNPLDMQGCNFENANLFNAGGTHLDARKSNFKNAKMQKAGFQAKLHESDFSGALLNGSYLTECNLTRARFDGADLTDASLYDSVLTGATFANADLTNAKLNNADLRGADFSSAKLKNVSVDGAKYDEQTKFPEELDLTGKPVWSGKGADPLKVARAKTATMVVAGDFDSFMQQLKNEFDKSRVDKCIKMLKAESFSLFADVQDDTLIGVVKSQTDPDLVYSCRLTNEGAFACCTQNLFSCGGLRGALCKHLLVLLIGLTKSGELDPTRAYELTMASTARKPELDKDIMSETFLRYKGAQAGDLDWRPTETIPEDYYSF